jgi:hypothetical protein
MRYASPVRVLLFLLSFAVAAACSSCRSIFQAKRLASCAFEFHSFTDLIVAGTKLDGISKLSDLNMFDAGKLAAGFMRGELPMELTANIKIINPNNKTAALNSLDWILIVEGAELARGQINQRFEVAPGGGQMLLPVKINANLAEALKGSDRGSLMNLLFNISGKGGIMPSDVSIRVKPSMSVAGVQVKMPGYVTVKKAISSRHY